MDNVLFLTHNVKELSLFQPYYIPLCVYGSVFLCVCVCVCVCVRVNVRSRVHMCVEDRGAEIEWSCLMTGTADSFRESSER